MPAPIMRVYLKSQLAEEKERFARFVRFPALESSTEPAGPLAALAREVAGRPADDVGRAMDQIGNLLAMPFPTALADKAETARRLLEAFDIDEARQALESLARALETEE